MNKNSTLNEEEVAKFSALANEWWDECGKFKTLHQINPMRISYIKNKLSEEFNIDFAQTPSRPLEGLKALDVGCGGGLLCEPITRLGAEVTGVDASKENINTAKLHAKNLELDINYINDLVENLDPTKHQFDVILCLELIEHVANPDLLISSCTKLLKPNGLMFISTINRTIKSYALAIVGAEYILRWIPVGTHDWKKFLKPSEISNLMSDNSIHMKDLTGMVYSPLNISKKWRLDSKDLDVNYICYGKF